MRLIATLGSLLLLAACNAAPGGTVAHTSGGGSPNSPGMDWSVTFDLNSWGRPMAHWQVRGDGTGEVWRIDQTEEFSRFDIAKHHIHLSESAIAKFVEALDPLMTRTRQSHECPIEVTDMPYGTMVWKGADGTHTYTFNFGCRTQWAEANNVLIEKATAVVEKVATIDPQAYNVQHVGQH